MSDTKVLPTIAELIEVSDDLSTMSRKGLKKINDSEALGVDENDIMLNWTPDEARAHLRLARIEKGTMAWGTSANGVNDDNDQAWKLEIPVLPLVQLGRDCFVGTIKYRDLDLVEINPNTQRPLVARRIPTIAKYVLENDGFFGSTIVNVVGPVVLDENRLIIDHNCRIFADEGQHRLFGIRKAMKDNPRAFEDRLDDALPLVIYINLTEQEERQLFADINLNATKPPKAIGLNYNDRNVAVQAAKMLIEKCDTFRGNVNYLKTRIGKRDDELFTFSIIVDIVQAMFDDLSPGMTKGSFDSTVDEAAAFWRDVDGAMGPHFEAKNFAINKNALIAIARLYGQEIDWTKLAELDWSNDGDLSRVASAAGGTNAAVKALEEELKRLVVE